MRRLIAVALLVAVGVTGHAAAVDAGGRQPEGTITLDQTGPFTQGDTVTFTVTTSGIRGTMAVYVVVECRSAVDGHFLQWTYGPPDSAFTFSWALWRPGEPGVIDTDDGECWGTLRIYQSKGPYIDLAQTEHFIVSR